ncbi:hypothetical protein HKD37_16G046122 [Glycine soja]
MLEHHTRQVTTDKLEEAVHRLTQGQASLTKSHASLSQGHHSLNTKIDSVHAFLTSKIDSLFDRLAAISVTPPSPTSPTHQPPSPASRHHHMKLDVPRFDGQDALAMLQALESRFAPSFYDDPQGALFKLQQTGTVSEYLTDFERKFRHYGRFPFPKRWNSRVFRRKNEELVVHRDQGLCYHCEDKWSPGHRCKPRLHLFIADDEPDEIEPPSSPTTDPSMISQISLNAMEGTFAPQTFRLLDIVLGVQWLKLLGLITTDYASLTMTFPYMGHTITLRVDAPLTPVFVIAHQLKRFAQTQSISAVFHIAPVLAQLESSSSFTPPPSPIPPQITTVLSRYPDIFSKPTHLPPHRTIQRHIHLFPNTDLVNVKPYRYPHFQKSSSACKKNIYKK